jgi:hypothetical protein
MKLFAYILSVYILILTATPCIDVPDNIMHKIEHTQDANHNHNTGNDNCSPFCTCQCCATPVVFQEFIVQFNCFTITQKHFSGYNNIDLPLRYYAIWQPPKIS